ncbi:hypothetical protein OJAV_G00105690 [Oryzias javanicus]|uniref:Uncharacterized protein n=1 Tax=Oryzias javanicus TaxID=123683 RepID=A0A437CYJ4_ORYJA|nr:hypothetical protein OJAV_G00105690 [Oryzias javanicus]
MRSSMEVRRNIPSGNIPFKQMCLLRLSLPSCRLRMQLKGRRRLQHHNRNLSWFGMKETRSFSGGFEVQEEKRPHERIFKPTRDQLLLDEMKRP